MKRIVLFSMPTATNVARLSGALFPPEMVDKIFAYMPSNGSQTKQVYTDFWKHLATRNKAEFLFVDNLLPEDAREAGKIESANLLLITGGNTFELLNNLRNSNLDLAVKTFVKKDNFVLAGFSAGAIVLTPTIATASVPSGTDSSDMVDENTVGLTDLTGLNIVDFEIIPHFEKTINNQALENYRKQTSYEVREISDDDVIVLDL